jgi:hypothetical protein
MRIKLLSLFCGAALGLSFSAAADVNGDMNNFFNKLGLRPIPASRRSGRDRRRVTPPAVRCMPERR